MPIAWQALCDRTMNVIKRLNQDHAENLTLLNTRDASDTEMHPRCTRDTPAIYPRFTRDISEIHPRYAILTPYQEHAEKIRYFLSKADTVPNERDRQKVGHG